MFDPELKLVKRVFINSPKERKEDKSHTIAAPMVEGKLFIGSGEDGNYCNETEARQHLDQAS